MKKTIFALFAVLLVLLMVTCDFFEQPHNTDDGLPDLTQGGMMRLDINVGNDGTGRSLTVGQAEDATTGVNYYEVAFKDPGGSTMYRLAWPKGVGIQTIYVPLGTYNTADKAVLFAGYKDPLNLDENTNKTLLAVGVITAVNGTAGTTITPSTTSVTFTMSSLLNDVNFTKSGAGASSFQITGPTTGGTDYSTPNYGIGKLSLSATESYPMFRIPEGGYTNTGSATAPDSDTDITATYKINCGTAGANNANYLGVVVASPGGDIPSKGYPISEIQGLSVIGKFTNLTVGNAVPSDGKFELLIDVKTNVNPSIGLSRLSIEVPVYPINATYNPGLWFIRGGKEQGRLDEGITASNPIGGAVLLSVGPVSNSSFIIQATPSP